MAQAFVRNRLTWLSYLMLAYYGYFLNIFGPITPFLKNELSLSYTDSSLHFSAFALGIIGAGLAGGRAIERLGRPAALWIGAFGMALSAAGLIAGRVPWLTISASFLMGLIGSLILTIVPSVLADQHGDLRAVAFSEGNLVASVVCAFAPVLVGAFAATLLGWRAALGVGVAAALVLGLVFNRVALPPAHIPAEAGEQAPALPPLYWLYWAGLVMAVSVEFCMVFWSADYFETSLGTLKASAAQAVSLFLIGMMAGRLAASRLERRFGTFRVVIGSLLIAAAGFLTYWAASAPLFGMIGLGLTGLGVASLYPLTLALAIGAAGRGTVRASAYASLASGVAIFALPLILGRLADAIGIRDAYGVVIVLLAVAMAIIFMAERMHHKAEMGAITTESIRDALSQVDAGAFGANLHYHEQVSSTMDIARTLAGQGAPEGTIVMADEQTAGRGRMGRTWVAPPGSSLMFTTVLRPSLPPDRIYRLVMACGLAAAEGSEAVCITRIDVKWPNDLQIGGKKLVGILPESSLIGERIEWAIVGMGINANQLFGGDLATTATSLRAESGAEIDRVTLLTHILARLNFWNARLEDDSLLAAWRGRCVTLNQTIQVEVDGQTLTGTAEEIDETGALWLRDGCGQRHRLTISEAHIVGS